MIKTREPLIVAITHDEHQGATLARKTTVNLPAGRTNLLRLIDVVGVAKKIEYVAEYEYPVGTDRLRRKTVDYGLIFNDGTELKGIDKQVFKYANGGGKMKSEKCVNSEIPANAVEEQPVKPAPAVTQKAKKTKVMVIGIIGEEFAYDLAKKGFDVMIVRNMGDAFVEHYGEVVYRRNIEGDFEPVKISTGEDGQIQMKLAGLNRQQRRKILRNLNNKR